MNKTLYLRRLATVVVCIALLGQVAYAAPEDSKTQGSQGTIKTEVANNTVVNNITVGTVTDGPLNVRKGAGKDQAILGKLNVGDMVQVNKSENGWHFISTNKISGWVSGDYIGNIKSITTEEYKKVLSSKEATANKVVEFAKQQLGKPYSYGSSGPNAFDCSGLVNYVYKNFGITVPRTSASFANVGTAVSLQSIQPGDIVAMDTSGAINGGITHVGLYAGNGQLLHASTDGRGVVLDSISSAYCAPRIVKIVRVL